MKHQEIIKSLEYRLKNWGYNTYVNQEYDFYKNLSHKVGECDLYAVKDRTRRYGKNSLIIVEVKTLDSEKNRDKAKYQLYKDRLWLNDILKMYRAKVGLFYAYSNPNNNKDYIIEKVNLDDYFKKREK